MGRPPTLGKGLGGGAALGPGAGGTAGPAAAPRPDFCGLTAVSIPGWRDTAIPHPSRRLAPTPSAGAPEGSAGGGLRPPPPPTNPRGKGLGGGGRARCDLRGALCRPATFMDHRAPPSHSSPSLQATPRPRLSITSSVVCFTILTEEGTRQRRLGGARGVLRRPGGGSPDPTPPLLVSEADGGGGRAPPARFPPHAVLAVQPGGTGRLRGGR